MGRPGEEERTLARLRAGECLCSYGFGLPRRFRFSGGGDISAQEFKTLRKRGLLERRKNPKWTLAQSYKFEDAWFLRKCNDV